MTIAETAARVRVEPLRSWGLFVLIGAVLYTGLYVWSEHLVYEHGEKNRFFMIGSAAPESYDFVILGASHAMPLGFGDIGGKLERDTGTRIMNLSTEGAGILPNRLLLDYFLTRHTAANVIYVLDSFAFYSSRWNEDRLDSSMLQRAPVDPALIATLASYQWAWHLIPAYASGFGKINNHDRFARDIPEAEASKFERVYRPIPQIDRQRIKYLYPQPSDPKILDNYMAEFENLISLVQGKRMKFIIVRPPTPPRYRNLLPEEVNFDRRIADIVARNGVSYYDFSETITDDKYFYDTDHLNRDGVLAFIAAGFGRLLKEENSEPRADANGLRLDR